MACAVSSVMCNMICVMACVMYHMACVISGVIFHVFLSCLVPCFMCHELSVMFHVTRYVSYIRMCVKRHIMRHVSSVL